MIAARGRQQVKGALVKTLCALASAALSGAGLAPPAAGEEIRRTAANQMVEVSFTSSTTCADPFNEAGFPWLPGYTQINPAYFDAADARLAWLAETGLSPYTSWSPACSTRPAGSIR